MTPALQNAAVAVITAVVVGVLQQVGLTAPQRDRADANRIANFDARDELRICLTALEREMSDE